MTQDYSWTERVRRGMYTQPLVRSGLMTAMVLAVALLSGAAVWYEHTQGNLHRMRAMATMAHPAVERPTGARPGNMDVARLVRTPLTAMVAPEFLSATLAPGLGMQTLGLTVHVPGRSEVPVLLGSGIDASGNFTDGSKGFPLVETVVGRSATGWSTPFSMLTRQADEVTYNTMPDGGETGATFAGTAADIPLDVRGVETKVSTTLSGRAVDFVVSVRNHAEEPRAVVLRWEPRLLFSPGGGSTLGLPETAGAAARTVGLGTGALKVANTAVKRSYLTTGPEAVLRNPALGYAVHVIAVSPSIRSFSADAAKGGSAVGISFSTGSGAAGEDRGDVLPPGGLLQAHFRVAVTGLSESQR